VLDTVKAIEAAGFRDQQLHRLAMMLHDQHPLHPPGQGVEDAS
jgi:cation transport protein ChaC